MENPDHIAWATKQSAVEHVSMASFAVQFKYSDRNTAEKEFQALINNSKISAARRQRLSTNLTSFIANRAAVFWEKRATLVKAGVIAMKAAGDSMEVGYRQSKSVFKQHFQNEEREDAVENSDEENATSTPLTWTLSSRSKQRTAARTQQTSNKKSNGPAMAETENADAEEDLDSDEVIDDRDDTSDGTALGLKDEEDSNSTDAATNTEDAEADEINLFESNTNADGDSDIDDREELQDIEEAIASGHSPFMPLLKHVYEKVKGLDVRLPPVPSTFICQEYKEFYLYAHDKLLAKEQQDRGKGKPKNKNQAYHVDKDVLGALSGIVNTISPSTQALTFTPAIKADSLMPALDETDSDLADLMADLLETYCPGHKEDPLAPLSMESLRIKIWSLLAEHGATSPMTRNVRRRMGALQVVDHICTLISTNMLAPPTTEHVVVSVWSFILAVLLGGQVVRGIPGELASQAARDVRLYVEDNYGVTNKGDGGRKAKICGRKVDISLRVFANGHWNNVHNRMRLAWVFC